MKRWGFVITLFYAFVVMFLLTPGFLALNEFSVSNAFATLLDAFRHWFPWMCVGIVASGQALLLFLSVDTSWRRLRPRQHVAVTALLTGFFTALLASAVIWSLIAGIYGDRDSAWPIWDWGRSFGVNLLLSVVTVFAAFWVFWGALFYVHYKGTSEAVAAAVSWLLRGSVLELLIAVPAHVVVRQRGDCSAPFVTGFGIVTGIAIMLLSFGPGVLALYKKKYDSYARVAKRSTGVP
jgi:hypothetical protein